MNDNRRAQDNSCWLLTTSIFSAGLTLVLTVARRYIGGRTCAAGSRVLLEHMYDIILHMDTNDVFTIRPQEKIMCSDVEL